MPTLLYSPGQVFDYLRYSYYYVASPTWGGTYSYTLTFGDFEGFRSFDFVLTWEGTDYVADTLVLCTLADGERAPLDYFLRSPLTDGSQNCGWLISGDPPGSFADMVTAWTDNFLEMKRKILDEWSWGVWQSQSINAVAHAGGFAGQALCAMVFLSDQAYSVSLESINGSEYGGALNPGGSAAPPPYGVEGNPSISLQTGGLVQAVQDLANIDTTISLNQGAAVYSVGSREITEP